MQNNKDEIFNFPCNYPIKVFGKKCLDFETVVCDIVSKHCGKIDPKQITIRESSKGKFSAITINILATSRVQIDAINLELQTHKMVDYLL